MEQQWLLNKTILILFLLAIFFFFIGPPIAQERMEKGRLTIFFMDEEVGFEEYTWKTNERGYLLETFGQMTKPIPLEITKLLIRLDSSFIPTDFYLKGTVSGVNQEITTTISDGYVENSIQVSNQKRNTSAKVRRDAFLLPNAIFSPYIAITKKFRCRLHEQVELAAYIVPQLEMRSTVRPKQDTPCFLIMKMRGIEIELETDSKGNLNSVVIPSQRLKVIQSN